MSDSKYDLLIIGAGVTGSALLYLATKYTDIKNIGVIEKYAAPARVNSLSSNNSQTLHCGDIETNYTLDKALKVQRAARMLREEAERVRRQIEEAERRGDIKPGDTILGMSLAAGGHLTHGAPPNNFFARAMASSSALSTNSQPP